MSKMMKQLVMAVCFCIAVLVIPNAAYSTDYASISVLPAAVQETAKRQLGLAQVVNIEDGEFDGIDDYEIEARTPDGRELQIEIGKDGTLYQREEEIRFSDLPATVLAVVKKELGNVSPDQLKRQTEYGKVHYELEAEALGRDIGLKIATDGTILEKQVNGNTVISNNQGGGNVLAKQQTTTTLKPWNDNTVPGSDKLPLEYVGQGLPDPEAPDGHLMYSPGVQNIQVNRANRKHPPALEPASENRKGWTYQHHVGIGCWKGKLYAVWDMSHVGEDNPPCHLVYSTSTDGFNWSAPKDLYPFNKAYNLRFYFFHSSNDRMLVFAAGWYPTDNISESRKDRLYVREITANHKLGRIYTLIKPGPGHPPFYTQSEDAGFLQACREALANKPLLEQGDYGLLLGDRKMKWHDGKNWPGGEVPHIGGDLWRFGKALCFYHRRIDSALVGVCKMGFVTQSFDEGNTWSLPVIPRGIHGGGGKLWAQRTPDGRYAMIYIPQGDHRYPMAITTSDDGITFRDMRVIHGEVPPQRYEGRAKDMGPQYLRGISEWGGDAPSLNKNSIWTIYSVNKEDIWVSRIPVPIVAETQQSVNDNFDNIAPGPRVPGWNTYSPLWAPVRVAGSGKNHYLELEDREPTDYARAIRTFPVSRVADVSFRVAAAQTNNGRLEIELLGELGKRPIRVVFNNMGQIQAVDRGRSVVESYSPGLTGSYFNKPDFRDRDEEIDILQTVDNDWGENRGNDWSARWTGFIEGPYDGQVTFTAEAVDGLRLTIGNQVVIDGLSQYGARSGKVTMKKGEKMPITLEFTSEHGKAALHLSWSWPGKAQTIVPAVALSHRKNPEIEPVDLMAYKANAWQRFKIHADCATGRFSLAVNGRQLLKNAVFAEPSSMVYAISFRTGKFRGKPSGRAHNDIPNSEEPLPKVTYRIDNVKTGNLQRSVK